MAAAVDAAKEVKALDAKIREVEKKLKGAAGDKEVALQQRLAALEQQKLLLMQQQSAQGVQQQIQQLEQQLQQQQQQQRRLEEKLGQLHLFQGFFLQVIDYSEHAITTAPSTVGFKQQLIEEYSRLRTGEAGDMIWYMVTQQYLPKRFVIGAHLWKRAWQDFMWMLDLPGCIDDVRNGLLLFKPIEWAFDTSQLCFKLDQFDDFVPHLLNDNLKETRLIDKLLELCTEPPTNKEMELLQGRLKVPGTQHDITFGSLPAFPLKSGLNSTPKPFTRVLKFHARRASIKAGSMGWPHEPVEFMTGSPYQARAKVLAWFADVDATGADEAQPTATTDVREMLQQLA